MGLQNVHRAQIDFIEGKLLIEAAPFFSGSSALQLAKQQQQQPQVVRTTTMCRRHRCRCEYI